MQNITEVKKIKQKKNNIASIWFPHLAMPNDGNGYYKILIKHFTRTHKFSPKTKNLYKIAFLNFWVRHILPI